jgi:hypothetical protein
MKRGLIFSLTKEIEFTDSCRYNLHSDDQHDWNKLFGVCAGIFGIHTNSGRFAWRYSNGMIEISIYTYINGERDASHVKTVPINKRIKFGIRRHFNYLRYYINDRLVGESWIGADNNMLWGCGLYFGGNRRAPQTIIVEQKNLD